MQEPNLRASRRTLAGLLAAGVLVAGAGFYLGRSTSSEPDREAPAKAPVTPAPTASALVESRTLGRGDIIALAAAAADATTSGTALPEGVREAIGRRVEVALPFGCSGPSPDDSDQPLRWRYDENEETLRLHVAVERWAPSDWGLAQPSLEEANGDEPVIEGFWVARPWTSSTECPVQSVQAGTAAAQALATDAANAANSLAIAQFLSGGGRRESLREGRPFQSVQRVRPQNLDLTRGFRLVLSGRVTGVPGPSAGLESPVRCVQPGGSDVRPRCIVAVTLEDIRIENPKDGSVHANWPLGRD